MEPWSVLYAGFEHGGPHEPAPEQRAPIIGFGFESVFVQKAVIAGDQRVMHHHAHLLPSEPAKLIKIAEGVQEGAAPWIATACGVCRLGVPERFACHELVAHASVVGERLVGAAEPLFR